MSDDHDERAARAAQALDADLDEATTNALSLMTRYDGHWGQPSALCGADEQRAEHDVPNDYGVVDDHQRERSRAIGSKRIYDPALIVLSKGQSIVIIAPLPQLTHVVRARTPPRLPVVLSRSEVKSVLNHLDGTPRLVAALLYGSGMRLLECLELRVKDVDLERQQITIRRGKGRKDRVTMLPVTLIAALRHHLDEVHSRHAQDLSNGFGDRDAAVRVGRQTAGCGDVVALAICFPSGPDLP